MITKIILLCMAGFLASFVDSIAGGGGLISVPAFMLAGLPPHMVLGTNKFSATAGSFTSSLQFIKSGKANFKLLKYLIPFTFIGSILGVKAVLHIDQKFLNTLVLILIMFIGIYTLFSKSLGLEDKFQGLTKKNVIIGVILALFLGFYDGFFGPGTGSFLVFGFISIFGFNFVTSSANARILNFVSNITALTLFALSGKINYMIGLPVAVSMIIGAKMGTIVALNKGSKLIKPIFVTMSLAVALKMLTGLFKYL
ncbi:TSUP family transporter [Clostridium estertheticum]|uniref:TSUP family transporter n=1 Tax=Clostridium estertheticum TaxID=238834 RepID=UPI001C0AE212|nr:TSUP family transporter [Clostridium estertheticum]MBU3200695.1 TSUP family transporter [Clostridium estertheticum]WAG64846.1 TSUP family transporter [Clostridium estertheticum]